MNKVQKKGGCGGGVCAEQTLEVLCDDDSTYKLEHPIVYLLYYTKVKQLCPSGTLRSTEQHIFPVVSSSL